MSDDDELLEYETEHEPEPEPQAVPVCLDGPVLTVATVPQHATCYTLVVDADVSPGFVELLPADPLRVRAVVLVNDQPVVICDSRTQANASGNQATNVPNPQGAYVPASATASTKITLTGTAQMFVAATTTDPARVSVIVERRSA